MLDDGDESDDQETKTAFFKELEARHGGPLSYEDLRQWDATLDDDSGDDNEEDVARAPAAKGGGCGNPLASPPMLSTSDAAPLPREGWLTPSTPPQGKLAPAASAPGQAYLAVVCLE